MSLRLRLLVAVGLIAVVALVVADFATYSALRSSLYQQVDEELAQHPQPHLAVDPVTGQVAFQCSSPTNGPAGGPGFNVIGFGYVAVVSQSNATVASGLECPAYVGEHPYRPQLPSPITGFTTQPNGTEVSQFTTGSIAPEGPAFRVRARPRSPDRASTTTYWCRRSRSSVRRAPCTRSS